ncbi:MAG: hypothetical protein WHV67_10160 [Thermoanaerobaculia bacterium]
MKKIGLILVFLLLISLPLLTDKEKEKNIIIVTFQLDKNFKLKPFYYDPEWHRYREIDFGKKMELFKTDEEMRTFEKAMEEYKKYLQKCHPDKKIN